MPVFKTAGHSHRDDAFFRRRIGGNGGSWMEVSPNITLTVRPIHSLRQFSRAFTLAVSAGPATLVLVPRRVLRGNNP
jgi:hypothetical protein